MNIIRIYFKPRSLTMVSDPMVEILPTSIHLELASLKV